MDVFPRGPPPPKSMETLQRNYPREAKYFKPGSKAGKRPQLVWERLWSTTNGEYGSQQYIRTRPITKGQLRDDLWKNRKSDSTYRDYGQINFENTTTTTPQVARKESRMSDKNYNLPSLSEQTHLREDFDNGVGYDFEVIHEDKPMEVFRVLSPVHSSVPSRMSPSSPLRLPPIEDNGYPAAARSVDTNYILSGVGKAHLQHSLGRYWDTMRRSYIKC